MDSIAPCQLSHQVLNPSEPRTLVLVHGIGGSGTFASVTPELRKRFRVVVYDQRGHGASPASGSDYSPSVMADDLARLLRQLRVSSAHVLGHSYGGKIALGFAERYPDVARSVIVEDMGVAASDLGSRETYLAGSPGAALPSRMYVYDCSTADLRPALRAISGKPVLFVFARAGTFESIRKCHPSAEIAAIPGAAHSIHISHPEPLLRLIFDFTARVDSQSDQTVP